MKSSAFLWGIDWRKHFPVVLGKANVCAEVCGFDAIRSFIEQNFQLLGGDSFQDGVYRPAEMTEAKIEFYRHCVDSFVFKSDGKTVGVFMGNALDWSTYYIRFAMLAKEFQGQKIFQDFMVHLLSVLKQYPIERVEAEVSPAHFGQIHMFNKLRFNLSGCKISERWGAMQIFTKHLKSLNEQAFVKRFCTGITTKGDEYEKEIRTY